MIGPVNKETIKTLSYEDDGNEVFLFNYSIKPEYHIFFEENEYYFSPIEGLTLIWVDRLKGAYLVGTD